MFARYHIYTLLIFLLTGCSQTLLINGSKRFFDDSECGLIEFSCKATRASNFQLRLKPMEHPVYIDPDKIHFIANPGKVQVDSVSFLFDKKVQRQNIKIEKGETLYITFADYSPWDEEIVAQTQSPRIIMLMDKGGIRCNGKSLQIDTLKIGSGTRL